MNYNLRTANLEDLPTLYKFEQGIVTAERPYDPTLKDGEIHYYDLNALVLSDTAEVLVVELEGKVVASGYAKIVQSKDYLKHDQYIHLGFMYVEDAHRGKGLNKKILNGLIAWSDSKGIREIKLEVYDDNLIALKAYEKAGFKRHLVEMRLIR